MLCETALAVQPAALDGFRFVKRDPGKHHRGKDNGDCAIRALAIASGMSYPAAWQLLYDVQGRLRYHGFYIFAFLDQEPATFGVRRKLSFPAVKGQRRLTLRDFCERHPQGSWIVQVVHHAAAVEDGVLYDRWDCSERCLYAAWEIDPAALKQEGSR